MILGRTIAHEGDNVVATFFHWTDAAIVVTRIVVTRDGDYSRTVKKLHADTPINETQARTLVQQMVAEESV